MQYFVRQIFSRRLLRVIVAAAFLVVLLAEWGSHGLACSHVDKGSGQAFAASESPYDDPCNTLVKCPDSRQHDQRSSSYDPTPHNVFFQRLSAERLTLGLAKPQLPDRDRIDRLFRPFDPPIHPPELT